MAKSITVSLELDTGQFNRGLTRAEGQVQGLSRSFGGLKTVIGAASAVAGGFAVKGILDATLKMENFRTVLTAYLGSQQLANDEISRLSTLANSLTQDVDDVTASFIILKRNGIDAGNEALTAFSKVAAGNGKTFEQLAEAVADALTGEFERLKEFGVKVSKENDQFSIRFADGSTRVVNSAREVVDAVREQGEAGGKFADVIAGPLSQAFSNLNGVVFEASSAFGEGFAPAIAEAATAAKEMIAANKDAIASFGRLIGEGLQWFLDNMDTVVTGIKAFVAVWATFAVANLIQGIATLVTSMGTLRTAVLAVNAALLANPITAIATAIAAAAVLIITNWDAVKKFFEDLWQRIQDLGQMAALKIELYWGQLRAWFLSTFAPALQVISDAFFEISRDAQASFAGIKAAAEDPLNAFEAYKRKSKEVVDQLNQQRAAQDTIADTARKAADAVAETEREIAGLEASIANRARAATEEQAEALEEIPPAAEEAAQSCQMFQTSLEGVQSALQSSTDATDENTESTKENAKAAREAARVLERQKDRIEGVTGAFEDSAKSQVDRLKNERELLDYFGEEKLVQQQLNSLQNEHNRAVDKLVRLRDQGQITEEQYAEALAKTNAEYEDAKVKVEDLARANYEYSRSFEYGFKEAFNNFKEDALNSATLAGDLFQQAAMDWRNAWVEAANTGKLSFDDLLKNMKNRIVAFLADAAFIKLTQVIADAFGINVAGQTAGTGGGGTRGGGSGGKSGGGKSIIDAGIDFVKGLFGFANGGYVAGNKSVIVGERGPEVFTPSTSGTIVPNFAGASSGQTIVTYNINALDSASFVNMLASQPDIIHGIVQSKNAEMMTRGRF